MNTYFPVSPLLFNGFPFLFLFLPLSLFVFSRFNSNSGRLFVLVLANYIFYALWNPRFCLLLFSLSLVSYWCAGFINRLEKKKIFLRRTLALAPVLLVLAIWFFLSCYNRIVEFLNLGDFPFLEIVPVLGFFTYSLICIGYVLDVFHEKIKPAENFISFACFASLFPCLIGGPVIRYGRIREDLDRLNEKKDESFRRLGWSFFTIGFIEKVLIADTLSVYLTGPLKSPESLGPLWSWLSMLAFTYMMYFDMSGYFNMATGLAYLFGLRLPQNFDSPLRAGTIKLFFQKWNITFHEFLRDFVYIPLGGKQASALMTSRNIFLTVIVSGLWLTNRLSAFLCFVLLFVCLTVQEKIVKALGKPLITFFFLLVAAVFYRSATPETAVKTLNNMFGLNLIQHEEKIPGIALFSVVLFFAAFLSHWAPNTFQLSHKWKPLEAVALAMLFLFSLFMIAGGHQSQFVFMK